MSPLALRKIVVSRFIKKDKQQKSKPKVEQRPEGEVLKPKTKLSFHASPATEFKKGRSGNVNGRAPSKPTTEAMRRYLNAPYKGRNKEWKAREFTNAEVLGIQVCQWAMDGDMSAMDTVLERTEGKVPNPTTLSGPNGGPIDIAAMTPEEKMARIAELTPLSISAGE